MEDSSQLEQPDQSTSLIADRVIAGLPVLLGGITGNPTLQMMSGMVQAMAKQHLTKLSDDQLIEVFTNIQSQISYWITGERSDYPKTDTPQSNTGKNFQESRGTEDWPVPTDESGCEIESL